MPEGTLTPNSKFHAAGGKLVLGARADRRACLARLRVWGRQSTADERMARMGGGSATDSLFGQASSRWGGRFAGRWVVMGKQHKSENVRLLSLNFARLLASATSSEDVM